MFGQQNLSSLSPTQRPQTQFSWQSDSGNLTQETDLPETRQAERKALNSIDL